MRRVIIVGSGISGLSAARSLLAQASGRLEVILLESRECPGGRAQTQQLASGAYVEMGATWLHGVESNPLYDLAVFQGLVPDLRVDPNFKDMDIDWRLQFMEPCQPGTSSEQLKGRLRDVALDAVYRFTEAAEECNDGQDIEAMSSVGEVLRNRFDEAVSSLKLSGDELQVFAASWCCREKLQRTFDGFYATDDVSLAFPREMEVLEGPNVPMPGGWESLICCLADGLDIRFGHKVSSVEYGSGGVVVTCAHGAVFECDAVIMTTSVGILQAHHTSLFAPPLPEWKKASLSGVRIGVADKIFLEFEIDESREMSGEVGEVLAGPSSCDTKCSAEQSAPFCHWVPPPVSYRLGAICPPAAPKACAGAECDTAASSAASLATSAGLSNSGTMHRTNSSEGLHHQPSHPLPSDSLSRLIQVAPMSPSHETPSWDPAQWPLGPSREEGGEVSSTDAPSSLNCGHSGDGLSSDQFQQRCRERVLVLESSSGRKRSSDHKLHRIVTDTASAGGPATPRRLSVDSPRSFHTAGQKSAVSIITASMSVGETMSGDGMFLTYDAGGTSSMLGAPCSDEEYMLSRGETDHTAAVATASMEAGALTCDGRLVARGSKLLVDVSDEEGAKPHSSKRRRGAAKEVIESYVLMWPIADVSRVGRAGYKASIADPLLSGSTDPAQLPDFAASLGIPQWCLGLHSVRFNPGPCFVRPSHGKEGPAGAREGSSLDGHSAVMWITGEAALEMERASDEEVQEGITKLLQLFPQLPLPAGAKMPPRVVRTKWGTDPNFLGSYSYSRRGVIDGTAVDLLAQPLEDAQGFPLVMFAGEATYRPHMGTAHGAFLSGLREANRLIEALDDIDGCDSFM